MCMSNMYFYVEKGIFKCTFSLRRYFYRCFYLEQVVKLGQGKEKRKDLRGNLKNLSLFTVCFLLSSYAMFT